MMRQHGHQRSFSASRFVSILLSGLLAICSINLLPDAADAQNQGACENCDESRVSFRDITVDGLGITEYSLPGFPVDVTETERTDTRCVLTCDCPAPLKNGDSVTVTVTWTNIEDPGGPAVWRFDAFNLHGTSDMVFNPPKDGVYGWRGLMPGQSLTVTGTGRCSRSTGDRTGRDRPVRRRWRRIRVDRDNENTRRR